MAADSVLPLSVGSSEVGITLANTLEEQYRERWPILLDALFTERCQRVHLRNIFIRQPNSAGQRRVLCLGPVKLVEPSPNADGTPIRHTASGLLTHYCTYNASVLPVFTLGITPTSSVLCMGLPPTGRMLAVVQLLSSQTTLNYQQPLDNGNQRQLPLSWEECGEGPPPEGWSDARDSGMAATYRKYAKSTDRGQQAPAADRSTLGSLVEALMHRSIRAGCCMVRTSSGDWSELEAVPGNTPPVDSHTLLNPLEIYHERAQQGPDSDAAAEQAGRGASKAHSLDESMPEDGHAQVTCVMPSECGWSQRIERVLPHHATVAAQQLIRTVYRKGSRWWEGCGSGLYDAALIEAPCCATQEAVLDKLHSGTGAPWPQEPEECIMQDQQHLLVAAFQALKPGGTLVYSTSSLAGQENDEAVRQAVAALGGSAEILGEPASDGITSSLLKQWGAEKTSCGWAFLPDASFQGPSYFSLLRKREQIDGGS